jgi:hypothetical protein
MRKTDETTVVSLTSPLFLKMYIRPAKPKGIAARNKGQEKLYAVPKIAPVEIAAGIVRVGMAWICEEIRYR